MGEYSQQLSGALQPKIRGGGWEGLPWRSGLGSRVFGSDLGHKALYKTNGEDDGS